MNDRRIISIGGGNMARAIIGGLLAEGYKNSAISVVDPDAGARTVMADECGVETMARAPVILMLIFKVSFAIAQPMRRVMAQRP